MGKRIPSRRMLAAPTPTGKATFLGYLILGLMLAGLGFIIYSHPYFSLFTFLAVAVLIGVEYCVERRRLRRLRLARPNENICTFVRSFDYRNTDTWILRAVYEELSNHLAIDDQPFPIRADDFCCDDDLKIDAEDFEDMALDIAARAERSMENSEKNPYYGKVRTVRDLVAFLSNQPRINDVPDVATAVLASDNSTAS